MKTKKLKDTLIYSLIIIKMPNVFTCIRYMFSNTIMSRCTSNGNRVSAKIILLVGIMGVTHFYVRLSLSNILHP